MIFIFYLFFFDFLFSKELADGVVAVVENNIITHSEVLQNAQMNLLQSGKSSFSSEQELNYYYNLTLENLINQKAFFEYAKLDTNIIVVNDDVMVYLNNYIDKLILQHGSVSKLEKLLGKPLKDFKNESWDDVFELITTERFQQSFFSKISVSTKEVIDFYSDYKDSLGVVPATWEYSVIHVPVFAGKKTKESIYSFLSSIKDSLLSGVDFESLALRHSDDPGSYKKGGDLGYFKRGSLVQEYEKVAFSLNPGEISNPIESPFGYHLIETLNISGEKIRSRHILKSINPSEEDKYNTLNKLKEYYYIVESNPSVFDSIALNLTHQNNNLSAVFNWVLKEDISSEIFTHLKVLKVGSFSDPFEIENGFCFVYLKNKRLEQKPDLYNSWDLIKNITLENKTIKEMNKLLNVINKRIYIKHYN